MSTVQIVSSRPVIGKAFVRSFLAPTFDPRPYFTEMDVRREPQLFTASVGFAYANGGPITRAFLEAVSFPLDAIVDTKVVMLMPGWYPCIPGWHHDDVSRPKPFAQPYYHEMDPKNPCGSDASNEAYHAMALVDEGTGSLTEFLYPRGYRSIQLRDPRQFTDRPYYGVWNDDLEARHLMGDVEVVTIPDRTVVYFDNRSWHRGVKATGHGWRWFGRIAANTGKRPVNEIRTQVQIYSDSFTEGW